MLVPITSVYLARRAMYVLGINVKFAHAPSNVYYFLKMHNLLVGHREERTVSKNALTPGVTYLSLKTDKDIFVLFLKF